MAYVPKAPFTGKLVIDASSSSGIIYDLAPGATRSLKRTQDGVDAVLNELPGALAQHGKALGLADDTFAKIDAVTNNISLLRAFFDDSKKLTEVLGESLAIQEDAREALFSTTGDTVRRGVIRNDPAIEAAFEQLLKYVAQVGVKAAATRRKNEAAGSGDGGDT